MAANNSTPDLASTEVPSPTPEGVTSPADEKFLRQFENLIGELSANVSMSRQEWFKQFLDPRRDLDRECGYPDGNSSTLIDTYRLLYKRNGVAARVVEVMPKESWQVQPLVYEDEDPDSVTDFEVAIDNLSLSLRNAAAMSTGTYIPSWYQDRQGSVVWEYLRRADILSGIGSYGVMLLLLNDGKELDQPAEPGEYVAPPDSPKSRVDTGRRLMGVRVFPQYLADIVESDNNPGSPRWGHPVMYNLTFNDPRDGVVGSGAGPIGTTRRVHWTRVIHLADTHHTASGNEVFAPARMEPVLNNLLDIAKLYGGSAEMYWRGAFPGWALETHPTLGGAVKIDREKLKSMMEDWANGLQRYLALMGMSAKSLAPQVVDPRPQIEVQISGLCIKIACPVRIFKGSERGELASKQDDINWNDRLKERHYSYLTPKVICPFFDRLIWLGVLPEPEGYSVYWPDLTSQTENERADVAIKKANAISTYVAGGGETIMDPFDFWTRVLWYTDAEADSIIRKAVESEEQAFEQEIEQQHRMIDEGLQPDPTVPKSVAGGSPVRRTEKATPKDSGNVTSNKYLRNPGDQRGRIRRSKRALAGGRV